MRLQSAVLTIVGFEAGNCEPYSGPYAVVILRDEHGKETAVKTIDDAQCRKFEQEADYARSMVDFRLEPPHPALGRRLVIEYQELTNEGLYRHPRWDRWEDE